ncbi:MAG TPA: discoidin domain-containing protein [Vicinamibacteria bacterium]
MARAAVKRPRLLLVLILVAAAALRLIGLGWGLPHQPSRDERVFVESAWKMRVAGDADQRFYEYPGLVFDLLAAVFLVIPAQGETPPPIATAAARGVIAVFGVASVGLVYAIGNRLLGRRAGLFAAALLAVSPVAVETAHMVRPDVVLETFVLLTFLALAAAGRGAGADVGSALALGAAMAAKLTGWLLAPVYVAGRVLAPGSWRRLVFTLLLAVTVMVAFTPSAVLRWSALLGGLRDQVAFHYAQTPTLGSWARLVAFYAGVALRALGPIGLLLAVAGVVLAWGDLRSWLGIVLFPGVLVAVLATAVVGHDRLLVPALGLLTLLAAGAFDAAAERRPDFGMALAGATLAVPLAFSVLADVRFLRPNPYERALGWLQGRPQDRVLFIYYRLKLDSPRFQLHPPELSVAERRLLARHFDLVASPPDEPEVAGFRLERAADPDPGWPGPHWPRLAFYSPGPLALRYEPVDLRFATLAGSEGSEALSAVADGEPDTAWSAAGDGWLQVDFAAPVNLGRITIEGTSAECPLGRVWTANGTPWAEPTAVTMSGARVLDPAPVRALRLGPAAGCAGRFRVAELRLEAAAGAP